MQLWERRAEATASVLNRSRNPGSSARFECRTLTATGRSRTESVARHIVTIPPEFSLSSRTYRPARTVLGATSLIASKCRPGPGLAASLGAEEPPEDRDVLHPERVCRRDEHDEAGDDRTEHLDGLAAGGSGRHGVAQSLGDEERHPRGRAGRDDDPRQAGQDHASLQPTQP